jgi:hypothetical protein
MSAMPPAPDFLRMALELGAARCLRKPFTPGALLAVVNECVLPSPIGFRRRCPVELTMFAPPCAALAIFAAAVELAERARDRWRCN